jgi:Kef-type K+ transport system membrane component KefB
MLRRTKRLVFIFISVIFLLLIPYIAMQFTDEVNWKLSDFVVAGTLLLSTGLLCELAIRNIKNIKSRIAICVILIIILLLIWVELAVGIFN